MQTFEKTHFCMGTRKTVETGWNKILFLWSCCSAVSLNVASLAPPAPWCKNIRQVIVSYDINLWGSFIKEKSFNTHLLQGYFSELKEKNPNSMQGAWGRRIPASPFSIRETVSKWSIKCWMSTPSFPQVGEELTYAASYVRKELPSY